MKFLHHGVPLPLKASILPADCRISKTWEIRRCGNCLVFVSCAIFSGKMGPWKSILTVELNGFEPKRS